MVNSIFKKVEVSGSTVEEALAKSPFKSINTNATAAFKKWKATQDTITEDSIKQFMLDYIAKKKNLVNVGYYIVDTPAVASTKTRPWKITNIKNETGPRKFRKAYLFIDKDTNQILGKVILPKRGEKKFDKDGNEIKTPSLKALAAAENKRIISEGFKGTIVNDIIYTCVSGNGTSFITEYAPSEGSHNGTYTVFGLIEA